LSSLTLWRANITMDSSSVMGKPMRGGLSLERPRLKGRNPRRGWRLWGDRPTRVG